MKRTVIFKIVLLSLIIVSMALTFIIANGFYQNKQLFKAIETNDFSNAKKAIDKGAFINTRKSLFYLPNLVPTNPTPLIAACKKGDKELVDLLLENGADINKTDNYTQKTPLLASLHGNKANRFSLAMYLINKGADIHAIQEGVASPFSRSLYISKDDTEQTKEESVLLLDYLLHNNAETKIYTSNENALTYATHYRNDNAVKYLIENNYFDVNSRDNSGDTALIVAVKNERTSIVKLLLEFGADRSLLDNDGKTALDYAFACQNSEIVSLLELT